MKNKQLQKWVQTYRISNIYVVGIFIYIPLPGGIWRGRTFLEAHQFRLGLDDCVHFATTQNGAILIVSTDLLCRLAYAVCTFKNEHSHFSCCPGIAKCSVIFYRFHLKGSQQVLFAMKLIRRVPVAALWIQTATCSRQPVVYAKYGPLTASRKQLPVCFQWLKSGA